MGQTGTHTLSEQNELLKVYAIEGKTKQLNLTYLIHRQSQQSYLLREHIYNNQNEFDDVLRRIQFRLQFRSAHLTNLIKVEQFQEDSLCSKQYRIYALWDYSKTSLSDEISERALQKRTFSSQQLRSMLSQLTKGMLTLQKNKTCHESITTKTILLEQPFNIKIVDPIAYPLRSNLDLVTLKRTVKNIYLSPEQCSLIKQHPLQSQIDPFRSDAFTIAIIILECALLQRQDQCYAEDCSVVNWNKLEFNLQTFQDIYGSQLKYILTRMLKINPKERIDWYQLDNGLSRGQFGYKNILNTPTVGTDRPDRISLIEPSRNSITISHAVPVKQPLVRNGALLLNNSTKVRIPFIYRDTRAQLKDNDTSIKQVPFGSRHIESLYLAELPKRTVFSSQSLTQNQSTPDANASKLFNYSLTPYAPHIPPKPFSTDHQLGINSIEKPNNATKNIKTEFSSNDSVFVIEQLQHGSRYEGYKLKGQRQGWGTFYFQQGGKYEGEWRQNVMSGKGKLYYQSGRLAYEGNWSNDKFHGQGILYNDNPELLTRSFDYSNFDQIDEYWISYMGEFKEDMKEGSGKLELTNGEVFEGSFYHDSIEGQGTFYRQDGRRVRGVWRQNKLEREFNQ